MTALLGVLRRPQTAEEVAFSATVSGRSRFFPFVGDRLYAGRDALGKHERHGQVRENVFSIPLERRIDRAVPERFVWQDASGAVVNAFEPEVFYSDFARPG